MKNWLFAIFASLSFFISFTAINSYAQTIIPPSFPSCNTPQGSVVASYSDGTHGIVGGTSSTGSDQVFQVSDQQVLQCLCSGSTGVQTNWWKIPGLTLSKVQDLEKQGWVYVPSGLAWGLVDAPYLAQNINGSCDIQGGFTPKVLGSSVFNSLTNGIACGSCIWWPILLGEVIALILFYGVFRKSIVAQKRKYFFGFLIGAVAYIIFLILNRNCLGSGVMRILWLSIPCKYFWLVDGVVYVVLSFVFRVRKSEKASKSGLSL